MTVTAVQQKVYNAEDIRIEWSLRKNYCVLTGIERGQGFYVAIPPRTFHALRRRGIVIKSEHQSEYGPEIWVFKESV